MKLQPTDRPKASYWKLVAMSAQLQVWETDTDRFAVNKSGQWFKVIGSLPPMQSAWASIL